MLQRHVSTHMSHYQAKLEPLNVFESLLTVLLVSKAADPCLSSGRPSVLVQLSHPAGVNNFPQLCYLHYLHMGTKITGSNNSKKFNGSKVA
jgi:hypothetical protein